MEERIEYRVRPVTRYIVTRYAYNPPTGTQCQGESGGVSDQRGEYTNYDLAYAVGYALAKADHDRLGYPPGDERIQYPTHEPTEGLHPASSLAGLVAA